MRLKEERIELMKPKVDSQRDTSRQKVKGILSSKHFVFLEN
jgi:hypothetical protein